VPARRGISGDWEQVQNGLRGGLECGREGVIYLRKKPSREDGESKFVESINPPKNFLSESCGRRDTNQIKSPNPPTLPITALAVTSAPLPKFNFWSGTVALRRRSRQRVKNKQTKEKKGS
jgi:hypothetical protein